MIKITEETKIKDIIPAGYDIVFDTVGLGSEEGTVKIFISKKKEVKDFNWYKEEYLKKSEHYRQSDPTYKGKILFLFSRGDEFYKDIPFEIRIGLLKFICDDLKVDFKMTVHEFIQREVGKIYRTEYVGNMLVLLPKEFINSLFD